MGTIQDGCIKFQNTRMSRQAAMQHPFCFVLGKEGKEEARYDLCVCLKSNVCDSIFCCVD